MATSIQRLDTLPRGVNDSLLMIPVSVTLSGNYSTGGDTLNFSALTPLIPNQHPPLMLISEGDPKGYFVEPICGSAQNNSLLKFYTANNTELTAGAYPAALSGYTFNLLAIFNKF